ncbi:MAG: ZIP family metal transporter [Candidatus Aenigmarchaeota archaeon]|nr:ZIP family metal transporter [Candidatus Aenigmarchaeota archaeon]
MINIWIASIFSAIIVSLVSLIGIFFISMKKEKLDKILIVLIGLATGGLFGDAFIHLIPSAFQEITEFYLISMFILIGILIFFILEKFLRWRHCHIQTSKEHPHYLAFMNIAGDALHNFFDGIVIGASYIIDINIGIATTLAVIFHEIPQEIGDFGILIYSGMKIKKALLINFITALTAIFGVLTSLFFWSYAEGYIKYLIPITAGGFIYIAGSDLIPELHHNIKLSNSILQFISIIFGIIIMYLLLFLE